MTHAQGRVRGKRRCNFRSFENGFCIKAKPTAKDLKLRARKDFTDEKEHLYSTHLKNVKHVLNATNYRISIPLRYLKPNTNEEESLYELVYEYQNRIRFKKTVQKLNLLIETNEFIRDKPPLSVLLNSLCQTINIRAVNGTCIECNGNEFGLSERLFFLNLESGDTAVKTAIIAQTDQCCIKVHEEISVTSPYPSKKTILRVIGDGWGGFLTVFCNIVINNDKQYVPDIYLKWKPALLEWKFLEQQLYIKQCARCDKKAKIWLKTKQTMQNFECGDCLIKNDKQSEISQPIQQDELYLVDEVDALDDDIDLTHVSKQNNQLQSISTINLPKKVIYVYLGTNRVGEAIKNGINEFGVKYKHKTKDISPYKGHCTHCHCEIQKGRKPGIFCKICGFSIHIYCSAGAKDIDVRTCYGCLVGNLGAVDVQNHEYENRKHYSPLYIESAHIFTCNRINHTEIIYYFELIKGMSVEGLQLVAEYSQKAINNDVLFKIVPISHNVKNKKVTWVDYYRGFHEDVNHQMDMDLMYGEELFTKDQKIDVKSHVMNSIEGVNQSDDIWVRCCNDKTAKRDSVWFGYMPIGKKYNHCIESYCSMDDFEVQEIMKICKPKIMFYKEYAGYDEPYVINTVQMINYRPPSWKVVHFDGQFVTNHRELFGLTLDKGKKMVIGSTMTMGTADNKHNVIDIPPWSIYRFGPNMLKLEWHGICRVTQQNRTVMFRNATPSLQ